MEFFEVIRNRRSIRHFTGDPVRDEDLTAMLEAARLAPSSTNQQPWHFIVIRDRELITDLRDIVNVSLDALIDEAETEDRKKVLRSRRFYGTHIFDAPVVVTVLTRALYPSPLNEEPTFGQGLQSVGASIENLLLAATALGYGGCWVALPLELAYREIESILGVEKPWYAVAMLSIGVPARLPAEVSRKPLKEIVTFK
ncbi:MAG: nitroreductase family protein [Chloroflexi bacterium]|nr:nitroreductase family protein [Chloroflexota bacterium]